MRLGDLYPLIKVVALSDGSYYSVHLSFSLLFTQLFTLAILIILS